MPTKIFHLTDGELVAQLALRDDLTELEMELHERLSRATEELERLGRDNYQLEQRIREDRPADEGAIAP